MSHWIFHNPFLKGVIRRLPEHYKLRYMDARRRTPQPVHHIPPTEKWQYIHEGKIERVKDVPIPTVRTKEQDAGLWGGEEVVKGYTHPHFNRPYVPRYWVPKLQKRVFFSEILNRWFTITCTERTLHQVDDCGGFDEYILATHEVDLKSRLGMRLKREMLLALANKTGALADKAKRDGLLEKYKRHIIPAEEAEWIGLDLVEAAEKQLAMEDEAEQKSVKPLKYVFLNELIEDLKNPRPPEEKTDVAQLDSEKKSTLGRLRDKIFTRN